ncbi:type III-A CRISPR-associated RAMP protein Csm4 [Roseiflexus sp.]|uniref:type III-A CRISPR-associated RAMP protein Csm4 n=1 Tax=Roseiflexus sp. TaxID=2562120 RepID=UPI00398B9141
MNDFTVYFLTPPPGRQTLCCHFGRQGIGLEETGETFPSDSFFAALVAQAATLDDAALDADGVPELARAFCAGEPPLLHSSLFPRLGDLPLLPRPALPLNVTDDTLRAWIGKGFKRLKYLSPALFTAACAGLPITSAPLILQGGKVWMTEAEARTLTDDPWRRRANESDEAWKRRLAATPIWLAVGEPHVTVDRVSCASAYYEVGRVTFAPGAGLALLVRFIDPAWRPRFEGLLDLLAHSGLGGRRTGGSGAFAWRLGRALDAMPGAVGTRAVLLSRYLPAKDEIAALRSAEAAYQLVVVGGWLFSPGQIPQRRQRVRMVAEGSVLDVRAAALRGLVLDVRPDYSQSMRAHPVLGRDVGTPHPVYRSGLALTTPIPDWKEAS